MQFLKKLNPAQFPPFILFSLIIILSISSCDRDSGLEPPDPDPQDSVVTLPEGTSQMEASPQRAGDANEGYDYLVNGNYVGNGIPIQIFKTVFNNPTPNELGRVGDNATIPYGYTAVNASNGVKVVSANCLQCHAQKLNGELIIGLGNSLEDFTEDQSGLIPLIDLAVNGFYPQPSLEWDAYAPFRRGLIATAPHLVTKVRGVNPADQLAAVLAAHRNQTDLVWQENPSLTIPDEVIPTDVPAWWLLKKKNAMFYAGVGRGDFARIMMASSLLTLADTSEAREIDQHFSDVQAYINSIEPPTYPETIDQDLLAKGLTVFTDNCSACHGTYGADAEYPNLLVELSTINTDPLLSENNFSQDDFVAWYNGSWFGKSPNQAMLTPEGGYIAPPLDGVWATAPYLHNGSVPNLQTLLNSDSRPVFWKRTFNDSDYDMANVGWNYEEKTEKTDKLTYDTTIPGYGNQGHTFGDQLSEEDRNALVEYLKSL